MEEMVKISGYFELGHFKKKPSHFKKKPGHF